MIPDEKRFNGNGEGAFDYSKEVRAEWDDVYEIRTFYRNILEEYHDDMKKARRSGDQDLIVHISDQLSYITELFHNYVKRHNALNREYGATTMAVVPPKTARNLDEILHPQDRFLGDLAEFNREATKA